MFQLSQVVYFHVQHQYGNNQPKVLGIEQVRLAHTLVNGEIPPNAKAYRRRIDIVLEVDGGEHWIETKSLKGPFKQTWFKNTLAAKSHKDNVGSRVHRGYYRQFFHDMRLNDSFITADTIKADDILSEPGSVTNSQYRWYFHDYSVKKGVPPTAADITQARKWLCTNPVVNNRKNHYEHNLSGSVSAIKSRCQLNASGRISRRNTQSYITDLLRPYASPDKLDIESFVDFIAGLDP